MIKGTQILNHIISENERIELLTKIDSSVLNFEGVDSFYSTSYGAEIVSDVIFDKLTAKVSSLTNLKLRKQNIYARKYLKASTLKPHVDREGLDLTLSIQLHNGFDNACPIVSANYDGSINEVELQDRHGVLIKGRDLEHYRPDFDKEKEGVLYAVFFHWSIESLEYETFSDVLTETECTEIIESNKADLQKIQVLENNQSVYNHEVRSGNFTSIKNDKLDAFIKTAVGELELEGWQLIEYNENDKFTAHFDNGNGVTNRLFTVLVYLNADFEGGETLFVNSQLEIKPEAGKMLLFKNLNLSKDINTYSLHEGEIINKGTKYVLVNWVLAK